MKSHSNIPSSIKKRLCLCCLLKGQLCTASTVCVCVSVSISLSVYKVCRCISLFPTHIHPIKQGCNKMNLINMNTMPVIQSSYCYYQYEYMLSLLSHKHPYLVLESDSSTHTHKHMTTCHCQYLPPVTSNGYTDTALSTPY